MVRLVLALFLMLLPAAEVVSFLSGNLTLRGVLYRPDGTGPFPAVVYNHGSAMDSSAAIDALGPVFAARGWVFFAPYRRGQGLSASAGPYIMDQIRAAVTRGGLGEGASTLVRLLETDHLDDQLAALAWLRQAAFIQANRVAVAGNSFGGSKPSSAPRRARTAQRSMQRALLRAGRPLLNCRE